jgi:hypothetical protein
MSFRMGSILAALLVLGLGQGIVMAQDSSVSLGDVARKLKAQRPASQQRAKTFTNDDLSALPPSSVQPGEAPAKKTSAKQAGEEPAKTAEAEAAEKVHGEKYYRDQMGKLQDRLEIDRRELSVLEQKLGQNQIQYYPDPNKGLLQESGPTALSDVHKLQDRIAKKKAEVTADEEAIEGLREQLRHDGGDPAWVR